MPETLFFKDGRMLFLTTMDKDYCLSIDTKTKFENLDIRQKLAEVVRERRRDCEPYGR